MMKRSLLFAIATLLCSNAGAAPAKESRRLSTDIIGKDIGYPASPTPSGLNCIAPLTEPNLATTLYYNAALQPAIAVNPLNGNNVVAAWQQDCTAINSYFIVGENWPAMDIGIGYSSDGGATWNRTLVPFQNCNGGFIQGVGEASLAYSGNGKKVYLATKCQNISMDPNTSNQAGITVTVSSNNGATWSNPHWISTSSAPFPAAPDLTPSVSTSNINKNNAFVVYESVNPTSVVEFSKSTDAGNSWSAHTPIYTPSLDLGDADARAYYPSLTELPNGDLLCFMHRFHYATPSDFLYDIACIRSTDQGATWETHATHITNVNAPSTYTCGVVDSDQMCYTQATLQGYKTAVSQINNRLYVVFPYVFGNGLPQIGLCVSCDNGHTWSAPAQVNRTPISAPNSQAFNASVAVNDHGLVGVLYHDFRNSQTSCQPGNTLADTWLAIYATLPTCSGGSTGVGLNFVNEVRLSPTSYVMENGPDYSYIGHYYATNSGYNSLVACNHNFYAAYIQSFNGPFSPPQPIFQTPPTIGTLILDNNRRTTPVYSTVNGNQFTANP
ncbi:MAG: exo-alpha-sialidase [Verrucomicrobia bacterium]|nr:exo-alpha-sialidase [Verrucomicrobiota bacterium]